MHLWHADLSSDEIDASWATDILDDYERSRVLNCCSPREQTEYALSHGILRLLLGRYLCCAPSSLQFGRTPKGKPYILEPSTSPELKFSLARRSSVGVFAFSLRDATGVDVEPAAQDTITEDAFEYALSARERDMIASLSSWSEKVKSFLTLWTRKEAFLKARGDGLGTCPSDIDVSSANGSIRERSVLQDSCCVRSLMFNRNHFSAVALQRGAFDVTLRKFDLSTFPSAPSKLTAFA